MSANNFESISLGIIGTNGKRHQRRLVDRVVILAPRCQLAEERLSFAQAYVSCRLKFINAWFDCVVGVRGCVKKCARLLGEGGVSLHYIIRCVDLLVIVVGEANIEFVCVIVRDISFRNEAILVMNVNTLNYSMWIVYQRMNCYSCANYRTNSD